VRFYRTRREGRGRWGAGVRSWCSNKPSYPAKTGHPVITERLMLQDRALFYPRRLLDHPPTRMMTASGRRRSQRQLRLVGAQAPRRGARCHVREGPLHPGGLAGAAVDHKLECAPRPVVAREIDAFFQLDAVLVGGKCPDFLV